jgi:hypothetical protein
MADGILLNPSSLFGALVCTPGDLWIRVGTVKIRLCSFCGPLVCPGERVDEFTKSTSARASATGDGVLSALVAGTQVTGTDRGLAELIAV